MFITEQTLDNKKTIHEQLSKYLMTTLKPGADPAVVNDLMKVLHCYETQIEKGGGVGGVGFRPALRYLMNLRQSRRGSKRLAFDRPKTVGFLTSEIELAK